MTAKSRILWLLPRWKYKKGSFVKTKWPKFFICIQSEIFFKLVPRALFSFCRCSLRNVSYSLYSQLPNVYSRLTSHTGVRTQSQRTRWKLQILSQLSFSCPSLCFRNVCLAPWPTAPASAGHPCLQGEKQQELSSNLLRWWVLACSWSPTVHIFLPLWTACLETSGPRLRRTADFQKYMSPRAFASTMRAW